MARTLKPTDPGNRAEEAIVASLLVDETAIDLVSGIVAPEDFASDTNRSAFAAILGLRERREAVNEATLVHELWRSGRLDASGGVAYVARITAELKSPLDVERHAYAVRTQADARVAVESSNGSGE